MKRTLFGIMLIMTLALAACGDGDNGGEEASLSFQASDELRFTPETAAAAAGDSIEVTLNNMGALEHTWTLVGADVDVTTATEANAISGASTGTVPGGESDTITFTAPAAGTYQFLCTVPGHAAAGMVGTLTVN
jgi:uncharacterized cupredoxin-like copper-binding protein